MRKRGRQEVLARSRELTHVVVGQQETVVLKALLDLEVLIKIG